MQKTILVADDNPDDVFFFERFLRKNRVVNPIRVVADGIAAIDYLYGLEPFTNRQENPFPKLIFLDINMPRSSGYEVLEWLQAHTEVPAPRVIICTHAFGANQIEKCQALGAHAFLLKSKMEQEFAALFNAYHNIWEFSPTPPPAA